MNYKAVILSILLSFSLTSISFTQDGKIRALSLQEALDLAEKNNYQILIRKSQVEKASGENLESLSGFLPKFSISENYIRSNDPVTVFSLKLKQGIFSQSDFNLSTLNHPEEIDNFTTAFQIQQPVFNLDAIFGKSAAHLKKKASEAIWQRTQQAVKLQVKKAYFALILAQENLSTIQEALQSARAHHKDAQLAYQEGLVTKADVLAAEVRVLELEEQRIEAENQISSAGDNLKFLLGLKEDTRIIPSDSLGIPSTSIAEVDENFALTQRYDLRAVRLQAQATRRVTWMKRSGWLPRLNAFATIEWNAAQAFSKDASNWSVGFQLQWNLFDGLGHWGRTRQAVAQASEMETRVHQLQEQAKMELHKARRAVQAAKKRLQVATTAVKQAQESLRIVEARYEEGLEKTSDLLDAEARLTQAKLRLLKAKHDYNVALSELEFARGH